MHAVLGLSVSAAWIFTLAPLQEGVLSRPDPVADLHLMYVESFYIVKLSTRMAAFC